MSRFSDLLARLEQAGVDAAQVAWVDATHGPRALPAETQVIVQRADGRFAVGYVERGRLVPYEIVDSAAEACDLTYRLMTAPPQPSLYQSSAERAASRARGQRATERALARLRQHRPASPRSSNGGAPDADREA